MSDTSPQAEPADLQRASVQRRVYGRYRAKSPIRVDGALAFRKGDPVPTSHVERGVVSRAAVEEFGKGEGPAAILEPAEEGDERAGHVEAFLDRNADEVIADAPSLTQEDRARAIVLEEHGRNRSTVLRALGRVEATTNEPTDQEV